jgi:hypothetical protein
MCGYVCMAFYMCELVWAYAFECACAVVLLLLQAELSDLNQRIAENVQVRSQLDSILEETESAYSKIVEGSHMLLHTVKRSMPVFDDYDTEPQ